MAAGAASVMALCGLVGAGIARWIAGTRPTAVQEPPDCGQLKEEFLATVSHELRTPLNAILGWTDVLRSSQALPAEEVARGIAVIERNARRQLTLVEDLLAAAEPLRSPAGWERLDVRDLMRQLVDGLAELAAVAEVTLAPPPPASPATASPTPASPAVATPVWVLGDAAGLRMALRKILENAIRFTPAGGLVRAELQQSGGRALIAVRDSGPGIDPTHSAQLFEPFRQEDGSRSRRHGGLGLGLTIARKLIEFHGGRVDVRSDGAGQGSTFLITLPALAGETLEPTS